MRDNTPIHMTIGLGRRARPNKRATEFRCTNPLHSIPINGQKVNVTKEKCNFLLNTFTHTTHSTHTLGNFCYGNAHEHIHFTADDDLLSFEICFINVFTSKNIC